MGKISGVLIYNVKLEYKLYTVLFFNWKAHVVFGTQRLYLTESMLSKIQNILFLNHLNKLFLLVQGADLEGQDQGASWMWGKMSDDAE